MILAGYPCIIDARVQDIAEVDRGRVRCEGEEVGNRDGWK
jgi:hypothetical protein